MKIPTLLLAVAMAAVPATPALAAPTAKQVARYTFDAGVDARGMIADVSGQGVPLRVRAADGGTVRLVARGTGRAVAFPARCAAGAVRCPRVVLEGGDDADLDPGTRPFRWGASVLASRAQVGAEANIMQKGVATAQSQWKLQVGGQRSRAQCVVVGRGSTRAYVAKSHTTVADGRWHQITCVRTGAHLSISVDGRMHGSVALPAQLSIDNALPLRVGGRNLNTSADQYGGVLDDVFAVLG